jgi:hypothetical protein
MTSPKKITANKTAATPIAEDAEPNGIEDVEYSKRKFIAWSPGIKA